MDGEMELLGPVRVAQGEPADELKALRRLVDCLVCEPRQNAA